MYKGKKDILLFIICLFLKNSDIDIEEKKRKMGERTVLLYYF